MNNQERVQKYIKEYCSRCINKDENMCEIRIFVRDNTIITKCHNFKGEVKDETKKKKKKIL